MNKEARDRFFAGESVRGEEFYNDPEFFGEVVWEGYKAGFVTRQPDLEGEVYYTNLNGKPEEYPRVVKRGENGKTVVFDRRSES